MTEFAIAFHTLHTLVGTTHDSHNVRPPPVARFQQPLRDSFASLGGIPEIGAEPIFSAICSP